MAFNSFGVAIAPNGPNVGFPGTISRQYVRVARNRQVSITNGLAFGAGAVILPDAAGGKYQSLADFLATATNAQNLKKQFVGIAVRNVKTEFAYTSLVQSGNTTVVSTTASGSINTNSITVASATGIAVGQLVEGQGAPEGTTVTAISGTTVTLSANLTQAMSSTNVNFTTPRSPIVGFYANNQLADVAEAVSGITVNIPAGTPNANKAVYIRTVANSSLPGTAVGDFEAADDQAASTTATATINTTSLTVASATGIAVGQQVGGNANIQDNTFVTAVSGTTITISLAVTGALSTTAVTFSNMCLLGGLTDPWIRFTTGQIDENFISEVSILNRHGA